MLAIEPTGKLVMNDHASVYYHNTFISIRLSQVGCNHSGSNAPFRQWFSLGSGGIQGRYLLTPWNLAELQHRSTQEETNLSCAELIR